MRGDYIPPWPPRYGGRGPQDGVPSSEMRVSDAERSEIAEQLSRHYADGRLDQSEFDERMGRAMAAKTRGDLSGLLSDLPPVASPPAPAVRHRRSRAGLVFAVVLGFLVLSSWNWAPWGWRGGFQPHFGFLIFVVLACLFVRRALWGWHVHHEDHRPLRSR